jgi:hypothetical protein
LARHSSRLDRRRAAAIDSIQLWLLAAGALALIALTVWIVWPGALADELASPEPLPAEEETPMSLDREPPAAPDLAPQGDRFEDQYTAATSDLSAGGVAAAGGVGAVFESLEQGAPAGVERPQTPSPTTPPASAAAQPTPVLPAPPQYALPAPSRTRLLLQPRNVAVGAGAAAGLGLLSGAWLYNRWQRERNRPINRLRRGAKDMADLLADRLALDELPDNSGPVGGAAAVALTSLVLTRVLRGSSSDEDSDQVERDDGRRQRRGWRDITLQDLLDAAARQRADQLSPAAARLGQGAGSLASGSERLTDALRAGLATSSRKARRAARELPSVDVDEVRGLTTQVRDTSTQVVRGKRGAFMGLGASGLIAVAASAYVIWRLLRGNPPRTYPTPM